MGLRTVSGKKAPVNYALDRQVGVKDAMAILYSSGRALISIRCANLMAITGIADPALIAKVIALAEAIPDDAPWTKERVSDLCEKIGMLPFPRYVRVEHLEGQATLLVKVVNGAGPGVTELSYPKNSNRPAFNVLPAMKDEQINIPANMCLEVPVALVVDEGVLKTEFCLRKGVERLLKKREPRTQK
jgi:hypothetical protein